ncbi:lytic murein transglycosylase B [Roseateles oligotrophus]|uniref:Lytic murein transglycosylase B n=1 Tax=Roseateles oligotrophus TaxID=1769250 RepID=A0ABT2YGI1_9BURK|nr:lytic murein transglycosylase B [Roseateles oligotrophus]MCV2369156.1 lytic murein transglycosylase B [Roseateles oligotrophus]
MYKLSALLLPILSIALLSSCPDAAAKNTSKKKAKAANTSKVHDKAPQAFGERADLMRFGADLAAEQGWDAALLQAQLAQAKSHPTVQRLIMPGPPGSAKDWGAYRARFVEPRRLQAGLEFWEQNGAALARAEALYGVPAELIVGLIGVETFYGQITGGFRVIDALSTLAFDFPSGRSDRSAFFRAELAEFFKLCRREGLDPLSVKGSFAGAMGWPQFMPSSWNKHAVDFDGDGHVDLIQSPVDAIGSVAHYLASFGWQRGMTTHYSVALPVETTARALLLAPDIKPSFSVAQLQAAGAQPSEAALEHAGPLAVIELQMGAAAPVYWLGSENFYALTRYNWSSYYAMAVIEMGRTLQTLRQAR